MLALPPGRNVRGDSVSAGLLFETWVLARLFEANVTQHDRQEGQRDMLAAWNNADMLVRFRILKLIRSEIPL